MSGTKILSAFLVMVPATILLTAEASFGEPAAETCKASPSGAVPRGAHWYYHIDRATKQHCWYLGQVGGHVKAHARLAAAPADPVAVAAPEESADTNEAPAAAPATPAQTTLANPAPAAVAPALTPAPMTEAAPPQTAPPQTATAPAAAAPAPAIAQPAGGRQAGTEQFGTRWPENMPKTEELLQSDPAPVSDSAAERRDTTATSQTPSKWPVAEAGGATGGSLATTALRYFLVIGMIAIPLLLLAGWLAKYAGRSDRNEAAERVPPVAEMPRQRRRVVVAADDDWDAPIPSHPAVVRRVSSERKSRALTDPAQDLKASLSELMRDLRRADESNAPKRRATERTDGWVRDRLDQDRLHQTRLDHESLHQDGDNADDRAFGPYLEAAE
jgi:hypothetical protein